MSMGGVRDGKGGGAGETAIMKGFMGICFFGGGRWRGSLYEGRISVGAWGYPGKQRQEDRRKLRGDCWRGDKSTRAL